MRPIRRPLLRPTLFALAAPAAAAFNANPAAYGTALNDPTKPTALGQSGSLPGQGYTPSPAAPATASTQPARAST